jgi:hypothetical protein
MDYANGAINPSEIATLSLLGGVNRGSYHNGKGYGEESAIRADVVANRDMSQVSDINRSNENRSISNQIDRSNQFLTDRINAQSIDFRFADVNRSFQDQNRQIFNFQLDQQRANADIARAVAENKCCCEKNAQKLDSLVDLGSYNLR